MSKLKYVIAMLATVASTACFAEYNDAGEFWTPRSEISSQIPKIKSDSNKAVRSNVNFVRIPNVAQYKNADWSQVVGISYGISEDEAMQIAKSNPAITFFFRTTGFQMVLEKSDGNYRRFRHGDTVFFSGTPWWGSAPGLADGYVMQ